MMSLQHPQQPIQNLDFVSQAVNEVLHEAILTLSHNEVSGENKQNQNTSRREESKDIKDFRQSRHRSGSVPSEKRRKDADVQSISTMTGTHPYHKSDKRIDDLDPVPANLIKSQKPMMKESSVQIKSQDAQWKMDKNGFLVSQTLDITTIKYYFISIATKLGMVLMRDLQDIITVKTQKIDSFKCLFMMCLPMAVTDRSVYQLERYRVGDKGSRVKLVLISGPEDKFDIFKKSLFFELWSNGVLSLSNFEALTLLYFTNRNLFSETKKMYEDACNQYEIKNLSSEEQFQSWQSSLILRFKCSQVLLKEKIFPASLCSLCLNAPQANCLHRVPFTTLNQLMLQRILLHEIPICDFYLKLQMEANKFFHQKKRLILQKFKVREVFEFLEIDKKLLGESWFQNQENKNIKLASLLLHDFTNDEENWKYLPYAEAVSILDGLNLVASPLENISVVSKFNSKLLECFEANLGESNSFMDMDSQLPLTIYCTLISKNTQLKPIVSLLRDYFEAEDDFEAENRTLAAVKVRFRFYVGRFLVCQTLVGYLTDREVLVGSKMIFWFTLFYPSSLSNSIAQ